MVNICLILSGGPYIERNIYRLELFNEVIGFCFFTSLNMFRGNLLGIAQQYKCGWASLVIMTLYICVHIGLNLFASIRTFIESCKKSRADKLEYQRGLLL